jgi:hypothetical protein
MPTILQFYVGWLGSEKLTCIFNAKKEILLRLGLLIREKLTNVTEAIIKKRKNF